MLLPKEADIGALYVGGKRALEDVTLMRTIGASISLGLTVVDPEKHPTVKRRLRIASGDLSSDAPSIGLRFAELVQFIHSARVDGLNVYVHCAMGVSRSVTVCAAYLLAAHRDRFYDVNSVLEWIRLSRPQVKPNPGLLLELEKWNRETSKPYLEPRIASDAIYVRSFPDSRGGIVRLTEQRIALRLGCHASAAAELWSQPEVRTSLPSVLEFSRDFVSASKPMLLRQACDGKACQTFFSPQALVDRHGMAQVAVDVTPDGRADALVFNENVSLFAQPERRHMTLETFFSFKKKEDSSQVLYCSSQNDSLRNELPQLENELRKHCFRQPSSLTPLPDELLLALATTGNQEPKLEALNFWIGGATSITSAHRDRAFENLYLVLNGKKTFYMLPPTAPAWLPSARARTATWRYSSSWNLVPDEPEQFVSWLNCNLAKTTTTSNTSQSLVRPCRLDIHAGDLLYIPAGWVHEVHQIDDTVAVNWWFETRFDDARYSAVALAAAIADIATGTNDE